MDSSTACKAGSSAGAGFRFPWQKRCWNISSGDSSASLTSHLRGYFSSVTLTSSELTGGLRFLAVAQAWPLCLLTTAGTWPIQQNPGKLLLPHSWVHLRSSPTSLREHVTLGSPHWPCSLAPSYKSMCVVLITPRTMQLPCCQKPACLSLGCGVARALTSHSQLPGAFPPRECLPPAKVLSPWQSPHFWICGRKHFTAHGSLMDSSVCPGCPAPLHPPVPSPQPTRAFNLLFLSSPGSPLGTRSSFWTVDVLQREQAKEDPFSHFPGAPSQPLWVFPCPKLSWTLALNFFFLFIYFYIFHITFFFFPDCAARRKGS